MLGADVDAARRLIEQNYFRVGLEPFRQHNFLLVAARQVLDQLPGECQLDAELADERREGIALPTLLYKTGSREAGQVGQPEVLERGLLEDESLVLAILGHQRDAGPDRVARLADVQGTAIEFDRAVLQ